MSPDTLPVEVDVGNAGKLPLFLHRLLRSARALVPATEPLCDRHRSQSAFVDAGEHLPCGLLICVLRCGSAARAEMLCEVTPTSCESSPGVQPVWTSSI